MVKLIRYKQYGANTNVLYITGLATDTKPTDRCEGHPVTQGSTFYCIDSHDRYVFDGQNKEWVYSPQSSGGSGGGGDEPIESITFEEIDDLING